MSRREYLRNYNIVRKYGITAKQAKAMYDAQDGRCACCDREILWFYEGKGHPQRACIDHCHETGEVRGILCWECNAGIGKLGDSIEGLERAMRYLSGV